MNKGENPATWMLNVLSEKIVPEESAVKPQGDKFALDFVETWRESENNKAVLGRLADARENKDESLRIAYDTEFACPRRERNRLTAQRLVTIYWRSPAYNLGRLTLSVLIATLLSTVFVPIRTKEVLAEAEMVSL